MKYIFYILLLLFSCTSWSQNILIDDNFDDWKLVPFKFTDPAGDGAPNGVDFTDLRISNNEEFLFLDVAIGREIILQSERNLYLYIDMDDNPQTGAAAYGIGAELTFNFGQRAGEFYSFTGIANIRHSHIGLFTAPTVSSDRFEIAIKREFVIQGQQRSFANKIRLVLAEEIIGGDVIPNHSGGILYQFDNSIVSNLPSYNIERSQDIDFRFMAYNVQRDDLFNSFLQNSYRRIFQALQPDIIGFSEIYNHSAAETAALVENFLPSSPGKVWHFDEVAPDIRIVSRYSIRGKEKLDGNGAFHLDVNGNDVIVIVTHLPCCENENGRQQEIDRIMAFVREIQNGNTSFQVSDGAAIIIAGDMNFVGRSAQVNTLFNGEIVNQSQFGPSFLPDWNQYPLIDAKPYTTGRPLTYTWYSSSSSFSPGRLDYIAYTGSVLDLYNTFALNTPSIPQSILDQNNLLYIDTDRASDHLPVIADFSFFKPSSIHQSNRTNPLKINIFPNPSREQISVNLNQSLTEENSRLIILNSYGSPVYTSIVNRNSTEISIPTASFLPGTYFLRLFNKNESAVATFIVN